MEFSTFWNIYPRRVGRMRAEKLWHKLSEQEQEEVLVGLRLWRQADQWHQAGGMFIPYGSTFLAQRRWEDEPWTNAFSEAKQ
jgi:DNA replication protein DnaC